MGLSKSGYEIVIEPEASGSGAVYQESALPFSGSETGRVKSVIPERLRQMQRLYEYGREYSRFIA